MDVVADFASTAIDCLGHKISGFKWQITNVLLSFLEIESHHDKATWGGLVQRETGISLVHLLMLYDQKLLSNFGERKFDKH